MSVVKCLLDNTPLCKDIIFHIIEDYRIKDYVDEKQKNIEYLDDLFYSDEYKIIPLFLKRIRMNRRRNNHHALRDKVFGEGVYECVMDDIRWCNYELVISV